MVKATGSAEPLLAINANRIAKAAISDARAKYVAIVRDKLPGLLELIRNRAVEGKYEYRYCAEWVESCLHELQAALHSLGYTATSNLICDGSKHELLITWKYDD